jgi:hypothetical protein
MKQGRTQMNRTDNGVLGKEGGIVPQEGGVDDLKHTVLFMTHAGIDA